MGLLPKHDLTNTPWYEVVINLIGLWTAMTDQANGDFYALMCIDTTTNPVELTCIDIKSTANISDSNKSQIPHFSKFYSSLLKLSI